jgi:uncharacterized protein (DUF1697 family)
MKVVASIPKEASSTVLMTFMETPLDKEEEGEEEEEEVVVVEEELWVLSSCKTVCSATCVATSPVVKMKAAVIILTLKGFSERASI